MVILIDTNVALDFLTMRQPYYNDAREVIRICAGEQIQGYIAFHSLPNIFYILRKSHSETDRRRMLKKLCFVLRVTGASHEKVCNAIEYTEFSDFEDYWGRSLRYVLCRLHKTFAEAVEARFTTRSQQRSQYHGGCKHHGKD